MHRALHFAVLCGLLLPSLGCTISRTPGGRPTIKWHIAQTIWDSIFHPKQEKPDKNREQIDQLWRQGYGFNNPNPERIRNKQAPLNFDGSQYKP